VSDEFKKKLQLLAVKQGKTVTQLMVEAIEKVYGIKEANKNAEKTSKD